MNASSLCHICCVTVMLLVNAVSRELSGLLTAVPIATEYSGEDPVS